MKTNIYDVANYILEKTNFTISNMKLQKLVYYSHAYYLCKYNKPLIDEEFEAWVYGPVLRDLYLEFCKYRYKVINEKSNKASGNELPKEIIEAIDYVIDKYGNLDAIKLSEMTHKELPWIESFESSDWEQNIITNKSIKKYYDKQY